MAEICGDWRTQEYYKVCVCQVLQDPAAHQPSREASWCPWVYVQYGGEGTSLVLWI